jgi:hypothetical protein
MVEVVSSMVVELKMLANDFNAKVNSSMVEIKRMKEQVSDLANTFMLAGAAGLGAFTAILASSPEMSAALADLKLLWLDFAMAMGERMAPMFEKLIGYLSDAWTFIKEHPMLEDFLADAIFAGAVLTGLGAVLKLVSIAWGLMSGAIGLVTGALDLLYAHPLIMAAGILTVGAYLLAQILIQIWQNLKYINDQLDLLDRTGWTFSNIVNGLLLIKNTAGIVLDIIYDLAHFDTTALENDLMRLVALWLSYLLDLGVKIAEWENNFAKDHPWIAAGLHFQVTPEADITAMKKLEDEINTWRKSLEIQRTSMIAASGLPTTSSTAGMLSMTGPSYYVQEYSLPTSTTSTAGAGLMVKQDKSTNYVTNNLNITNMKAKVSDQDLQTWFNQFQLWSDSYKRRTGAV